MGDDRAFATASLPWPHEWRRPGVLSGRLSRRGHNGVELVDTEIYGERVPAVRFSVRPPLALVAVGLVVLGLVFLAVGLTMAVAVVVTQSNWWWLIGVAVLAALGWTFAAGGRAVLRRFSQLLGVDLTPDHVVVSLGIDRLVLAWDEIAEIRASSLEYGAGLGRKPVRNWIVIAVRDPAAVAELVMRHRAILGRLASHWADDVATAVPGARLGADPLLLYHTLRYYLDHPEDRAELSRGRAATHRIHTGGLG